MPSMLKCPVCCNGQFRSRYELRRHLTDVASLLNSIRCSQCDEGFASLLELADHLRTECVDAAGIPFKLKRCPLILVDCSGLSQDSTKASDGTEQPVTTMAESLGELLSKQQLLTDKENATEVRNLDKSTPLRTYSKNVNKSTTLANNSKNVDRSTPSVDSNKNLDKNTLPVISSKNLDKDTPSIDNSIIQDKTLPSISNIKNLDKIKPSLNIDKNLDTSMPSLNNNKNQEKSTPPVISSKNMDKSKPTVGNSQIQDRTLPSILNRKRSFLQPAVEKQPEVSVEQESPTKKLRILSQQELQTLLKSLNQSLSSQTLNQLKTAEKSSIATDMNNSTTVQLNTVKTFSKVTEIKTPVSTKNASTSEKPTAVQTFSKMTVLNPLSATRYSSTNEKPTAVKTFSKMTVLNPLSATRNSPTNGKHTSIQTSKMIVLNPLSATRNSSTNEKPTSIQTSKMIVLNPLSATRNSSTNEKPTSILTSKMTVLNPLSATRNSSTNEIPTSIQSSKMTVLDSLSATRNSSTNEKPTSIQTHSKVTASKTSNSRTPEPQHVIVNLDSDDDDTGRDSMQDDLEIVECFADDSPIEGSPSRVENEPSTSLTEFREKILSAHSSATHGQADASKPAEVILLHRGNPRLGTHIVAMNSLKKIIRTVPLLGDNAATGMQGPTKVTQLPTANQGNISTSHNDDDCVMLDPGPSATTKKQATSSKKVAVLPKDKRLTNIANDRPKLKYLNVMHPEAGTSSKEKLREGVTVDKILASGFDLALLKDVFFLCSKCKNLYDDLDSAENHPCKVLIKVSAPAAVTQKKVTVDPVILHAKPATITKRWLERELKGLRNLSVEKSERCDKCEKDLSPDMAEFHKVIHSTEFQLLFCDECDDYSTVVLKNLGEHKRQRHRKYLPGIPTAEAIFVCEFCEQEFNSYNKLVRHRRTIHPVEESKVKRFNCSYCGHAFKLKEDRNRHERIHTKEKPFSCDVCGKKFRISYSLGIHKRTHTGVRPYSCKECGKMFKSYSALAFHKKGVHSNSYDYQCHICPKRFKTVVSLFNHKAIHEKTHKCELCNRYFAKRHALGMHMKKMHTNRVRDSFVCMICKASYGRAWSLENHLKTHGHIAENLECLRTMVDAGRVSNEPKELVIPTSPVPIKPPRRRKPKC